MLALSTNLIVNSLYFSSPTPNDNVPSSDHFLSQATSFVSYNVLFLCNSFYLFQSNPGRIPLCLHFPSDYRSDHRVQSCHSPLRNRAGQEKERHMHSVPLKEWKHFSFKTPKRKGYKDLDKQVNHFLEKEFILSKNTQRNIIENNDWVCFNASLLTQKKQLTSPSLISTEAVPFEA